MTGHENGLLYLAVALAAFSAIAVLYVLMDARRRLSGGDAVRTRSIDQLKGEIATLKREHAQLIETVTRFRAQSLAGITETINETIGKRKEEMGGGSQQALEAKFKSELEAAGREFGMALEMTAERIARLEQAEAHFDARPDLQVFARRVDQLEAAAGRTNDLTRTLQDNVKTHKILSAGQVIDRFLSSLEDPEERLKCFLASFDSVADSATLGKLAVAYPNKNSWIILKELSEHGVVSEVAAWAMIAGARLAAAGKDNKTALHLYQGARHSFITCGGNQDGLWLVNTALAKLSEGVTAENYTKDAMANLFALKSNTAQSTAPLQLADFYQREERYEIAATLFLAVCELYIELDLLAYQASLRVVESFGQLLLSHYQLKHKGTGSDTMYNFIDGAVGALKTMYQRCPALTREAQAGILVAMMYVSRLSRDSGNAMFAANPLLALCQPQAMIGQETMANDFGGKIFILAPSIFDSILVTLDNLELTRKRQSMQILEKLTAAFLDTNSLTRASSCGAKLVDCALESFGDGAAETIEPISVLASIYRRMQRLDLVEECYRQILEIQYKVYSSESEELVDTMINLSDVCRMQDDVGQADIFLESALEMGEELLRLNRSTPKLLTYVDRARARRGMPSLQDEAQSKADAELIRVKDEAEAKRGEQELEEKSSEEKSSEEAQPEVISEDVSQSEESENLEKSEETEKSEDSNKTEENTEEAEVKSEEQPESKDVSNDESEDKSEEVISSDSPESEEESRPEDKAVESEANQDQEGKEEVTSEDHSNGNGKASDKDSDLLEEESENASVASF